MSLSNVLIDQILQKVFEGQKTPITREVLEAKLKTIDTTSDVEKLVLALNELKPDSNNSIIKKLDYAKLESIHQRIYQCLNSYGLEIGQDYYVDTITLKPKPTNLIQYTLTENILPINKAINTIKL